MEYYDGVILKPELSNETLEHYGVKGMKWGVRRYERSGGRKTQRRIAKFRTAESKYDSAKASYRAASSKEERRAYKDQMRSARSEMKEQYRKVKQARLADQGKELYNNNTRITDNAQKVAYASAGIAVASKILSAGLSSNILPVEAQLKLSKPINTPLGKFPLSDVVMISAAVTASTALAVDKIYKENQNRKLRAYYSYTDKD